MSSIKFTKNIFKFVGIATCSVFIGSQLYFLNQKNYEILSTTKPSFKTYNLFYKENAILHEEFKEEASNIPRKIIEPQLKDYIPKDATQQNIFLSKYPTFDGKGIKIAILDSGIDVSLEGLQRTSNGDHKVIDCLDFTGVGDVDTSIVKETNSETNVLVALSGRKFIIPTKWKNPSGKWHLGIKKLQKPLLKPKFKKTEIIDEIQDFKNEGKKIINNLPKFPAIDCIVWNDGEKWLACVIDTFTEDLEDAKVLTNFCDEHEYGFLHFSNQQKISYSVSVSNDGNFLQIIAPTLDHGSIVAQVAAANFPDEPERNGLAPGAQIISMNVLDLDYRDQSIFRSAVKKALMKCIEMKVDIVNFSIRGLISDEETEKLVNDMVKEHNILIFKSAGNFGPFYSTLNPGDACVQDLIFTIGAIVTSEMKRIIYKIQKLNSDETSHISHFSSRGPTLNGKYGIDFVAPGTAITQSPCFASEDFRISQGTSFSAPIAAGSVACILSGLKENSISYSPSTIKEALSKSAILPKNGNKLQFGHGIIQIDSAFDYFCQHLKDSDSWISKFPESCIFFVHKNENESVKKFIIDLSSIARIIKKYYPSNNHTVDALNKEGNNENANNCLSTLPEANHPVINELEKYLIHLKLSSEAEKFITLTAMAKNKFSVNIDTTKLEPGNLHHSEIQIFHPKFLLNPILNIPVTAIVPLKITESQNLKFQKEISLPNDSTFHIFIDPPFESRKKCEIKIIPLDDKIIKLKLMIRYSVNNENGNYDKIVRLTSNNQNKPAYIIPIQSKNIHEICIFQPHQSPSAVRKFKLEFDFFGKKENDVYDFFVEDTK